MLKNILKKINNWYSEKFQDTTREDDFEAEERTLLSKYSVLINASFWARVRFLITNKMTYRLTQHQFNIINRNPLNEFH